MKTFTFGIRDVPSGAVAWMQPPGDTAGRPMREKRFRHGYGDARRFAQQWIDGQIKGLEEFRQICPHTEQFRVVETHKQTAITGD